MHNEGCGEGGAEERIGEGRGERYLNIMQGYSLML